MWACRLETVGPGCLPPSLVFCRPRAGALAEERESLRQQLELERTAAAEAQKEVGSGGTRCMAPKGAVLAGG